MNKLPLSLALATAIMLGFATGWGLQSRSSHDDRPAGTSDGDKGDPLYWVAPMDDNYRRDQPGKSPMGMDLVPVYAQKTRAQPSQVRVSPTHAHNLGLTLGSGKGRGALAQQPLGGPAGGVSGGDGPGHSPGFCRLSLPPPIAHHQPGASTALGGVN